MVVPDSGGYECGHDIPQLARTFGVRLTRRAGIVRGLLSVSMAIVCALGASCASTSRPIHLALTDTWELGKPLPDDEPVMTILRFQQGLRHEKDRKIVVCAVFADGRLIWSHDLLLGGVPYYSARISPERVVKACSFALGVTATGSSVSLTEHLFFHSNWTVARVREGSRFVQVHSDAEAGILGAHYDMPGSPDPAYMPRSDLESYFRYYLALRCVIVSLLPGAGSAVELDVSFR